MFLPSLLLLDPGMLFCPRVKRQMPSSWRFVPRWRRDEFTTTQYDAPFLCASSVVLAGTLCHVVAPTPEFEPCTYLVWKGFGHCLSLIY